MLDLSIWFTLGPTSSGQALEPAGPPETSGCARTTYARITCCGSARLCNIGPTQGEGSLCVGRVHMGDIKPQLGSHLSQQAGGAPIQVVPSHHMVPCFGQPEHSCQRCHAAREGKAPCSPLQASARWRGRRWRGDDMAQPAGHRHSSGQPHAGCWRGKVKQDGEVVQPAGLGCCANDVAHVPDTSHACHMGTHDEEGAGGEDGI